MDPITIDGLDENDFRRSIENMLRHGEADGAASKLRALIEPYAGEDRILPSRFLTVSSDDLAVAGWDRLEERIGRYDRPNRRISALSITVTEPEEAEARPDGAGKLAPCVETGYFSDEAYPFSDAGRGDLLEGYSLYGCEWQGDCEETDRSLSVEGVDDLYGAVARLEAKLLASNEPSPQEIQAGSLGACYLAVLVHQAVRDTVHRNGLPRPLCIMAGSNGVYPFFDAPVVSSEECQAAGVVKPGAKGEEPIQRKTEDLDVSETGTGVAECDTSLLSLGARKGKKKPVIILDAAEAESASRLYESDAAQHMEGAGKATRTGVLAGFDAPDVPEQTDAFPDSAEPPAPVMAEPGRADEPCENDAAAAIEEAVCGDSADSAVPDHRAEPLDSEWAAPAEDVSGIEDDGEIAALAKPTAKSDEIPLPSAEPDPEPRGHSLRARMVRAPEPSTTFVDRIVAVLRWLHARLGRNR